MTFSVSVAAGTDSVESLRRLCENGVVAGEVRFVRHEDLAVAWAAVCPWIGRGDDGDVLVVLDGRLHNVTSPAADQADLLLQRYRRRGTEVARDLLGDFVLVVLDRRRRTLLVARDPVGVRPWYEATAGRSYAGASDVATLVALPWVDTSVNEHVAIEYLAAVEESRGETLYRGIRTLPPGRTWHRAGGVASVFSHHRWELEPELAISWEDAAERCRAVFDEAVRSRLRVGGPTASELSGGLDSSTVVGTAVQLGHDDLIVGRMVFDGPRADERSYSDAVIEHWGVRSVSASPWIPGEEDLRRLTADLGRPCPDANFTMFTSLYRMLLEEGRPDGLTGLGGDDAFTASSVGTRVVSAAQLRQWAVLRGRAHEALRNPRASWSEVLRPTLGYVVAPWRSKRRATWVSSAAARQAELPRLGHRRPKRVTGVAAIDERLANFTSGYNASILETRATVSDWVGRRDSHPFLDPRFVNVTYGLDPWGPTSGGHYRALHVAAFGDRLPPSVRKRRSKAEFSEVFWPQLLHEEILAPVRNGPLRDLGWLDREGFEALMTNAKRGMANAAIPLSRCASLDRWLRAEQSTR